MSILFLLLYLLPCVVGWVGLTGSCRNSALLAAASTFSSGDQSSEESSRWQYNRALQDFLTHVQVSVETGHFVSITLRGPSKAVEKGSVRRITGRSVAINQKEMIQATFKYHGSTDICKNWNLVDCTPNLKAILASQSAPMNIIPASEWGIPPPTSLGSRSGIQSATLQLSNGTEWDLKYKSSNSNQLQLTQRNREVTVSPLQPHDRTKSGPVDVSHPVWLALGVTAPGKNQKNTVKAGMSSKLRQCQKFVEIVQQRIAECLDGEATPAISIIDMGCGRGYLTFALHSFLVRKYGDVHVSSRGIDVRPKLVAQISEISSSQSDCGFERLRFETGTIESFLAESNSLGRDLHNHSNGSLEVIIALHACDTATDDALWSGISRNSDMIVVAPCCHRQVRPQLNHHASRDEEHPYLDVLRHNIYRERIAESVTDSLRALLLELSGYSVQIFEFIGGEHTSKNVMITAVKKSKRDESIERNATQRYQDILGRIRSLAALHGVKQQRLAEWMDITLSNAERNELLETRAITKTMPRLKRHDLGEI
jgi:Methyltransferase domain